MADGCVFGRGDENAILTGLSRTSVRKPCLDSVSDSLSIQSFSSSQRWTRTFVRRKKGKVGKWAKYYKSLLFSLYNVNRTVNAFSLAENYDQNDDLGWIIRQICYPNMKCLIICMDWGTEDHQIRKKYQGEVYNILPVVRETIKEDVESSTSESDDQQKSRKTPPLSSSGISSITSKMEKLNFICTEDEKNKLLDSELRKLYATKRSEIKETLRAFVDVKNMSPIPPSCRNFLQISILNLQPQRAEDPFLMFGIEVRCVDYLEKIYESEGLSKENFIPRENFCVSEMATAVTDILKNALEFNSDNESQPIMSRLIMNLAAFKKTKKEKWRELTCNLKECQNVHLLLAHILRKDKQCDYSTRSFPHVTEADLHGFLDRYINLDSESICDGRPPSRSLPQFRWMLGDDSIGQHCTTDLEFEFLQDMTDDSDDTSDVSLAIVPIVVQFHCATSASVQIKVSKELMEEVDEKLALDSELLFQCWKQTYAAVAFANYQDHGNSKVLQSCTIVVDQKVRNVILCINMEEYTALMKLHNARETIQWIRMQAQKDGFQNWCRLYVVRSEYKIFDIHKELKFVFKNCCKPVPYKTPF